MQNPQRRDFPLSATRYTFSDTYISAIQSSVDRKQSLTMPPTSKSSAKVIAAAQATAGANEPPMSEHQAALALLALHRHDQAMREARQELENQAHLEASKGRDSGDDVSMTTDDDLTSLDSASTDSDIARILALPPSPRRSPVVSEGSASQDSELTDIIVSGPTPPTSPVSIAGQSVQPAAPSEAIPSEQRRRLGLLARGEEGFEHAEPLEQWEWFSLAKASDEAREQAEQYRQHEAEWEVEYALNYPIHIDDREHSDYEEKGSGKRSKPGVKRGQKKVRFEN